MKTRSKPQKSSTAAAETKSKSITIASLPPSVDNPPKPFILPQDLSKDARIITLSNPATSAPNRYLFCPAKGFYEFTRIAAPKKQPRSWLFAPRRPIDAQDGAQETGEDVKSKESEEEHADEDPNEDTVEDNSDPFAKGYITQSADLFIATPMDGLFLVLPALAPESKAKASQKQMFLSLDDHLDKLGESSKHLKHILKNSKAKALLETRLSTVCDAVDAGDEHMYRISHPKLLAALLSKATKMTANGLPASMEDKFIRTALQSPVMSVQRTDTQDTSDDTPTPSESAAESQLSTSTAATSFSVLATDAPPKPPLDAPADILALLRLRTAFTFILTRYIPATLHAPLIALLSSSTTPDFAPLDAHLEHLATLRAEAVALRAINDNVSRKRAAAEDDEAAEMRAEKKRRKEEEEKRKKAESRGVRDLKKVDTSGMKKMSAFFGRAVKK